ncbi:MAG: hypothetical protein ACI97A_001354 [Planctomycetota bacterium]|jgi:hypothetical protein
MPESGDTSSKKIGSKLSLAFLFLVTIGISLATRWDMPIETLWVAVPALGLLQWLWFRQSNGQSQERHGHVKSMLLVAAVAHIIFVFSVNPLYTSDDINRYVFEGHVVAAGGNPYTHPPASPLFDDLASDQAIADIREGVNNDRIATIYPPIAEVLFALGTVFHSGRLGWLMVILLFDLLILFTLPKLLIAHEADQRWSVVYAFHPIILFEGLGGGHVDLIAVSFLVAAFFFAATQKRNLAWIFLSFSVLTKIISLMIGFALLKRCGWKGMMLAGVLVVGSCALCLRSDDIRPTPRVGEWRIVESQFPNEMADNIRLRTPSDLKEMLKDDESVLVSNSGGTAVVSTRTKDLQTQRSRVLLQHKDIETAKKVNWSDVVGQFQVVGFGPSAAPWDGAILRLDGQGRIVGELGNRSLTGNYWIEDERFLSVQFESTLFEKLELSHDLQIGMSSGFYLIKTAEKIGMGFRHYSGRWTANAPLFRLLESWMPGPDEFDLKRKLAQKFIAACLVIMALAFLFAKWSLPQIALWSFTALWLFAPAVYPWYLIWLIPFLGFSRSLIPLVFTYTGLAMHLTPGNFSSEYLVYLPVGLTLIIELLGRLVARRSLS